MKFFKKVLKALGWIAAFFLLYVGIALLHGTVTDFQPDEKIPLAIENDAPRTEITDSVIRLVAWNVGYGGLGAEADFFYDAGNVLFSGGMMVRPPKKLAQKYLEGIENFMVNTPVDFYLLQEIDTDSKRSYHVNQFKTIAERLPNFAATYAENYRVKRVPLPVAQPWKVMGKMRAGIATFSQYQPLSAVRYQFPSKFGWPTRIFQLDRCFAAHRFQVKNGKELLVINTHNSAYDKGGKLKKKEMAYLKDFILEEFKKGNYVVVGGDWNQCPPHFSYDTFAPVKGEDYEADNIAPDFLPENWLWAYDPTTPTNRKLDKPFDPKTSFTTLIDFFLISPNLKLEKIRTIDQQFQFSDHQPVFVQLKLN